MLLWEAKQKESLVRFPHPNKIGITGLAWCPKGNEIAWAGMFCDVLSIVCVVVCCVVLWCGVLCVCVCVYCVSLLYL